MISNFTAVLIYGIELNIGPTLSAGSLYNFSNQNQFNSVAEGLSVYGVETFTESQLAISPNGNTLVSAAGCLNATVLLVANSVERVQQVPYLSLNAASNNGFIKELQPMVIDWNKSGVTITNTGGISANESFYFNFYAMPSKAAK